MAKRKKKGTSGTDEQVPDDSEIDANVSEDNSEFASGIDNNDPEDASGTDDKVPEEVPEDLDEPPKPKKKKLKRKAKRSEPEPDMPENEDDLEIPEESEAESFDEEDDKPELSRGIKRLRKRHYRESRREELYEEGAPELPSGVRRLRRRHYQEKGRVDAPDYKTYGDIFMRKWKGSWLQSNWKPITILFVIFFFALFLRAYYGLEPATENGFVLSGGSDSYYYNYIIDNTRTTGEQHFIEPMLNYPVGTRNPRPPLYAWSVNLGGIVMTPFFGGNVLEATQYVFLFSTAFWGALTIFPVYLLATEAFGRKAGYISAFLLAVMPGHIQRSVLTNADHDAFALFFIVMSFYFFLRALKSLKEKSWVESWRKPKLVKDGLFSMMGENTDTILYALMSGLSLAAVALTWKGYAYVIVIMTAYFLIQVLLDRFRNTDSTEVLMVYIVTVGSALLLIFPYYYQSIQIPGWFDTPMIMFLAAAAIGAIFIVTRKLPWLLVIGGLISAVLLAMVVMAIVAPELLTSLFNTVGSGAGYFIRNKQYETIAEAQAPPFSNLALSFGAFTFWLSFTGVAWAMYQMPKRMKFDYIFVVIWTAASIFMATNAARFMFNAAPVFAITAGWIIALIVEKLNFKEFVMHHKRMVNMKITRGFVLALTGAGALLVLVVFGLSTISDMALPVMVVGILALISVVMMNLISEVNPKRYLHFISLLVPLGTAGFYLFGIFEKDWVMSDSTHGFILVSALVINLLIYLTVKKTKVSFTIGILFLTFFVVMPNVWAGLDAGIPYQVKSEYDKEIYEVMPVFLQPASYDAQNGSNWFLGGFGYSLPLNTQYYPAGYDWLATQDTDIYPPQDRPAFLSWWDYGFEAVNEGKHPTVADNFLGGHQLAGNFIMAQSEEQAISLLIIRILEADWAGDDISVVRADFSDEVIDILESYTLDVEKMLDIFKNPSDYKDIIWANPDIYGPRDDIIQPANAKYLAARGELTENLDLEEIVSLYNDVRGATGFSIRYFAIDSRLFPFTSQNTGIFYAPAKLSDHRISDVGNQPYDFFEIKAVGEFGGEYSIDDIPVDVTLDPDNPYKIIYKDMFYNSMLYKAFIGYSAEDIGQSNENGGIPGVSEGMDQNQIMPGWNMTHFKLVHRTAYWNPYSAGEIRNNTDAWQAMNYQEAVDKQAAGEGVSDLSDRSSIYQGVMMLKYYDGAIVRGRIELDDGSPLEGAIVTVLDEFGIPHDMTYTSADGTYSVIAPFGDTGIVTSMGEPAPLNRIGTELNVSKIFVEDSQAMREEVDLDGNGIWDYFISHDVVIPSSDVSGKVFWDMDSNEAFDIADKIIPDAEVTISSNTFKRTEVNKTDNTGNVYIDNFPPGQAEVTIRFSNRTMLTVNITLTSDQVSTQNWGIKPTTLAGRVYYDTGQLADNATVNIWIEDDAKLTTYVTENGNYSFDNLLFGEYRIQAISDGASSPVQKIIINHLENNTQDLQMFETVSVSGTMLLPDGEPAIGAMLRIVSDDNSSKAILVKADVNGNYDFYIEKGKYTVSASYPKDGKEYVYFSSGVFDTNVSSGTFTMKEGYKVEGDLISNGNELKVPNIVVIFTSDTSGSRINTYTNDDGHYSIYLPADEYKLYSFASSIGGEEAYTTVVTINSDASDVDVFYEPAIVSKWDVYYDINRNEAMDEGEALSGVEITYTDPDGLIFVSLTDAEGYSEIRIPEGVVYQVLVSKQGFGTFALKDIGSDPLSSRTREDAMEPNNVPVQGSIFIDGGLLLDENAYVEFTADNASGAISDKVQMERDGTYSIDLIPGNYEVNIKKNTTEGSDIEVIQIKEPVEVVTGFSDGSVLNLDIEVLERGKFSSNLTRDGNPSGGNLTFIGPDQRTFDQESGSADYYIVPGEYIVRASYAINEDVYLANQLVNITPNSTIALDMEESDLVSGTVRYSTGPMVGRSVTFLDTVTGDALTRTTDPDGAYSIHLVPKRTYEVSIEFIDFDDDGTAYKYYNRKEGDLNVVKTQGAGEQALDLNLEREVYTIRINGTVVLDDDTAALTAELKFISGNKAIAASTDVDGRFGLDLAPGEYTVFIEDASNNVYLEKIMIELEAREINFTVRPANKMSGTVYYNQNLHNETTLYFTSGAGTVNVTTDGEGYYNIWLPSDSYNVTGEIAVIENGIDITYTLSTTVELDRDLRKNIPMNKVEDYGVTLEWEAVTPGDVEPGESAQYTLTATNTGNAPATYDLTGNAEPGWTIKFPNNGNRSTTRLSLDYGSASNSETVLLEIRSPKEARVDHNPIVISIKSLKHDSEIETVNPFFKIKQTYDVSIEPSTTGPSFNKDVLSLSTSLKNPGNGPDEYTIYIANKEELASNGWKVSIDNSTAGDHNVDSTVLKNYSLGALTNAEIQLNLEQISEKPGSTINVLFVAQSQNDDSVYTSEYIVVNSPEISLDESEISVTGDLIVQDPTENPGLAVMMTVIAVAFGLTMFYVMKKKRWLR